MLGLCRLATLRNNPQPKGENEPITLHLTPLPTCTHPGHHLRHLPTLPTLLHPSHGPLRHLISQPIPNLTLQLPTCLLQWRFVHNHLHLHISIHACRARHVAYLLTPSDFPLPTLSTYNMEMQVKVAGTEPYHLVAAVSKNNGVPLDVTLE